MDSDLTLSRRQMRTLIVLLSVIAALLVLLVGGLAAGAVWGARTVAQITGRPAAEAPEGPEKLAADARESAEQLSRRQDAIAGGLAEVSRQTEREIRALESRRNTLSDASGGPLKKADTAIRMTQLMSDEMFVMLHNLARAEQVMARGVRPLPKERELTGTAEGNKESGASPTRSQARRPAPTAGSHRP